MPISTSTFDEVKNYVSVRLQQGVPLLDSDWNEKDDIRRHELRSFIKWFIGDGVPAGDNGFFIGDVSIPVSEKEKVLELLKIVKEKKGIEFKVLYDESVIFKSISDFAIEKGRILVDGWEVDSHEKLTFTEQNIFKYKGLAKEWGVETLQDLNSVLELSDTVKKVIDKAIGSSELKPGLFIGEKSGQKLSSVTEHKNILVYLDVWERIVTKDEDPYLENQNIGVETCTRIKREWVVRWMKIDQDQKLIPDNFAKQEDHQYYPLANICVNVILESKLKGIGTIDHEIYVTIGLEDLRRTGLCLSTAMIKTDEESKTTIVDQNLNVNEDLTVLKNCIVHKNIGIGITKNLNKPLTIESSGERGELIQFADRDKDDNFIPKWHLNYGDSKSGLNFVESGVADYRLFLKKGGNIGIGTNEPNAQLIIGDRFGAAISGGPGGNAIFGTNLATKFENGDKIYTPYSHTQNYGFAGMHASWGELKFYAQSGNTEQNQFINPVSRLTIYTNGNIGIGTTSIPSAKLEINGDLKVGNSIIPSAGNSPQNGIHFPSNPGGGSGDSAYIRYYARPDEGENTTFEIGTTNDQQDHIALMPSGNVGIGTTTPNDKLEVKGNILIRSPGNDIHKLAFERTDEDGRVHSWALWNMNSGYRKNALEIWEYKTDRSGKSCGGDVNDGAMCDPRLTILEGGNVGIGTTTPSAKLEVSGDLKATGTCNATNGGAFNGVSIGCNPTDSNIKLEYQYETICTNSTNFNLRLHSYNNIIFHSGKDGSVRLTIDTDGNVIIGSRLYLADCLNLKGNIELNNGGYIYISGTGDLYYHKPGSGEYKMHGDRPTC